MPETNHISVKLPDFWSENVAAWIKQAEAQFRIAKVSNPQLQFDYVIQKLDHDTVDRIQDLILDPPADNQYEVLKQRLLSTYTKSIYEKLSAFYAIPPLGDRRPTELMDQLLAAAAGIEHDNYSCPYVTYAFLSRLPPTLRSIASSFDFSDLRVFAAETNKAWSALTVEAEVCSVPNPAPTCMVPTQVVPTQVVPTQIADNSVFATQQQPRRPRPRRTTPQQSTPPCWYHNEWGAKARSCTKPCGWSSGNAQPGGRN